MVTNLYEKVQQNYAMMGLNIVDQNVELIKGMLQDTLNVTNPVLLAHIDVDWHDAVKVSIDRIWPMLGDKGVMIFDDYYTYSGCRKAVDRFLDTVDDVSIDGACGSMAIIKA